MAGEEFSFGRHRRPKRILFVCTGNTCRSPMAEILLREMVAKGEAPDLEIRSAGTAAAPGAGMSEETREVLAARGIDAGEFRSQPLTGKLVDWADLILTMTRQHKMEVLMRFPQAWKRVAVLSEWAEPERWEPFIKEAEELYEEIGRQQAAVRQAQAQEMAELERRRLELRLADPVNEEELSEVEAALEDLGRKVAETGRDQRQDLARLETDLAGLEVADPVGQGREAYEETAERLVELLKGLVDRLATPTGRGSGRQGDS